MQVYIVAGGYGSSYLSSTEILEKDGGSEWQVVASLPSELRGPRGLGLEHGRFIITGKHWNLLCHYNLHSWQFAGGYTGSTLSDEVLLYNSEDDEWTTVGHLSAGRNDHAMSLVPRNTVDFCLW